MGQEFGLVASGTWQTVKAKRNKRVASWSDSDSGQTILFEFRKNGKINLYDDKNNNGKINRKSDTLIGEDSYNKSYDKRHYSRSHFSDMNDGEFEIEVEGYESDQGTYEAFYSIRLYPGIEVENKIGSIVNINKYVDVMDHDIMTSIFQPDA